MAVDAAPTYSVYAPIVSRIWKKFGYGTIIFLHETEKWENEYGSVIMEELEKVGALIWFMPTMPPLSVANTMRTSRLVAACDVDKDDFILTSDVDMIPLNREFFDRKEKFVVLRALYERWLACKTPPPVLDLNSLKPGVFRFAMCYVGATAEIWREIFSLTVDEPVESLRRIVDCTTDETDFDELKLSRGILSSSRAQGEVETVVPNNIWRTGELFLVDPMGLPNLSSYYNMPRGMLRLGDLWQPGRGLPPPEAIDFIPDRFTPTNRPWWCLEATALYHPNERAWLEEYRGKMEKVFQSGGNEFWN